jgi:hypothetical protein
VAPNMPDGRHQLVPSARLYRTDFSESIPNIVPGRAIPSRYLGQIVSLLAKEDLKSLSLVNSDFHRFARAAQHGYVRPRSRNQIYKFLQYSIRQRVRPEYTSSIRFLDLFDVREVRSHNDVYDEHKIRRSRKALRLLAKSLPSMPHLETLGVILVLENQEYSGGGRCYHIR